MKKKFTILITAAVMLLSLIVQPMRAVGQTRDNLVLTFGLTSNPGGWPTSASTTLTNYTYTLNEVNYTFALKNVYCNSGYLMLKATAALGLPAISGYKLTKVVASNSSGCSTGTVVGISSSSSSASYISGGSTQTWSTQSSSYTYNLTSTAVNTMYYLYVTSKNAQVTQLVLTYEPESCNPPTFSPVAGSYTSTQNVTISSTTEGATIYYTTDGTTPTTSSLTEQPVSVATSMTIKAIAVKAGLANSSVSEAAYTISQAYNLTITSEHGTPTVTVNSTPVTPTAGVYSIPQDATVNLSVAPDNGYMFTGWTVNSGGVTISDNAFTMPGNAVAITANYDAVVSDVISHTEVNNAIGSQSSSTYYSWSGVQLNTAVYAGQSMYNKDNALSYIQIRNTSPSGIVTTTSGGYAKKIRVGYAYNNTNGRSLTVYGKHTAYTGPADLYDNNKRGEVLGTITFNTNDTYDELTIDGNWEYIGLLAGGAMYFEPITITWLPVTMYSITCQAAYYIPETETQIGAVTVDKASAAAGTTINLTAEGMNHYHFNGWTVTNTTTSAVVSVTGTTIASFTMPESNVTVAAAWEEDTKYTISKASGDEGYITVASNSYAGETVNVQIHDLPDGKVVDAVTVTKASSGTVDVSFTGQEAGNYNYTFTMPAENVTISVSFKDPDSVTVTYYVKGQVDKSETITAGNYVTLPTSTTTVDIDGFELLGWSTTNGGTTTLPAGAYYPESDIDLYAVLGVVSNTSLTITANTENFPTSYGTANTFTEYTLEGKKFKIQQGYVNGTKLQWRAEGNNNGTGTIYNNEDFGRLLSIALVYDGDSNHNFTMKAGTSANPTEGTSINQVYNDNSKVGVFDLSGSNYTYFVLTNGSGAGYLSSITIYYEASAAVGTVTEYSTPQTIANIPVNECVIVKDGGVLTLTGTNNGNAANLVIEEGGQLIHTTTVEATIKKNVTGSSWSKASAVDGWYTIASPVANASVSSATTGNYDFFAYNEENAKWLNQKVDANSITNFEQGIGYLYAHENGVELSYAGEMVGTGTEITKELSYDCENASYKGINLMGNPFTCNIEAGKIKLDGTAVTTYYTVEGGSELTSKTLSETPIKPGQGFIVQATGTGQNLVFNPSSKDRSEEKVGYISIAAGNSEFTDNAFVQIGGGNTLRKMTINENVPHVYVMNQGMDYAAATIEEMTGEVPVCFKAATDGTYTINVSTKGIETDYLHLIDNRTGMDIDLLQTPSYTFEASKSDYASRFRLVFSASNNNENVNQNENFGFVSNGNLMILGIEGEATLQMIDITGRILSTETFYGNYDKAINAKAGLYMLRLIQGENVRTQKIVVK